MLELTGARRAKQALGDDTDQIALQLLPLDTQLVQAGKRRQCAARMQSSKHQMPGKRRAQCHACRFRIADLANQDDIRILP